MLPRIVLLALIALIVTNVQLSHAQRPEYWISFNDQHGRRAILKIDSIGNVVSESRVIPKLHTGPFSGFGGKTFGTAITKRDTETLNYWTFTKKGALSRAILRRDTLEPVLIKETHQRTSNVAALHAAASSGANFLVFNKSSNGVEQLLGIRTSATGILEDHQWLLFNEAANDDLCAADCGGGVSSGGQFAWIRTPEGMPNGGSRLLVRRLNSQGLPQTDPVLIDKIVGFHSGISAADLTDRLPGKRAFVLYVRARGGAGETPIGRLFLQVIDSTTCEKVGLPFQLPTQADVRGFQPIAIDPAGRFVLFVDGFDLVFWALDVTGHPSGKRKILVSSHHAKFGAAGAVNIVRD